MLLISSHCSLCSSSWEGRQNNFGPSGGQTEEDGSGRRTNSTWNKFTNKYIFLLCHVQLKWTKLTFLNEGEYKITSQHDWQMWGHKWHEYILLILPINLLSSAEKKNMSDIEVDVSLENWNTHTHTHSWHVISSIQTKNSFNKCWLEPNANCY